MKGVAVEDLTVIILDRPRHEGLIREVRQTGARIRLIPDGDVSAAIATCDPDSGVDVLLGVGGAAEGVLAAAALRCMGGELQGRLMPRSDEEARRAHRMGLPDVDRIYSTSELAAGESVMFAATGVTDGALLRGVRFSGTCATTHSVVMRVLSGTVRWIEARHRLDKKPIY